jgi:hypothetical protein
MPKLPLPKLPLPNCRLEFPQASLAINVAAENT